MLCRWLTYLNLKGKQHPIHAYELLCPLDKAQQQQIQLCTLHESAKQYLLNYQYDRVDETCQQLLALDPNNIAALELQQRLKSIPSSIVLTLFDK
jgi:predicted Zn-dependent protease